MENNEVPKSFIEKVLIPLDAEMDEFLKRLFSRFLTNIGLAYGLFKKENYQLLETNIVGYLDRRYDESARRDYLFNNLSFIWRFYQDNGRVGEAQEYWQDILNILITWESSRRKRIHKGSVFYFWSQTAILQGQLDKGFLLIHSAVEEDCLTDKTDKPDTPAYKTVSLNYLDGNNLLFGLVTEWTKYLDGLIQNYITISGRHFTLDLFRRQFLEIPPSPDTLYTFTYALARFYEFDKIPMVVVQADFASVYEMNMLFDLVLVIDSIIFASIESPGLNDWKFINLASLLLVKSGISNNQNINRNHLGEVNRAQTNTFQQAITALLDQEYVYFDGTTPTRLECDLGLVYCLRNHSAHSLNSYPVIRYRFSEIRQSVFNILFLAVECL